MQVAAEEAIDDTLWRYSQQLYNKVPDFFLNSEDIYCRFRSLRAIYDNVNSSLSDPCTGGRPGIACWAIRERLRLNTLLNPYGAELAHVTPNVFCFRTLPSSAVAVFSKEFHLTGVYLVLWLLSEHRCITTNSTLLKIRLEDNLFTTTGAHSLLDGLEFNAVVAEVRLGSIEAILLGGLALNKTITRLNLDEWEFEAFAAEVLAEMLTRNRALHHISIRLRTRTEAWFIRSSLMRGIASNFSLLTLELQYGQERCSVVVCEVLHVLRRNELMLNRAVDFVANRNGGWTAAFAFQTLEKCYSLVDKLVGLYGCTSGEARNRIDVAVLFVHTQFFQLVTVSRGPLMCLDAPRGQRTQIDALPPECLSAIASFLNLEDVFVQERRLPFPLQFSLA
ncbi:hypothetical protein IscW_ISCW021313 [Ixodes scapularis]|uniref:Uncharacterized protein n=1 Tax=Ixodes scapularis TaxID=6945 RepID=B7Q7P2_IXOSC|nr:hypothetical protein IscW_ISCW021313 [Ixodes scapularis]|eukprot:XP_002404269.1 hypothetical protein IscW_ISCW021313 [Ixodes scapularis]